MDGTRVHRPRLLLMAYACRPGEGSEPGLGWNRAIGAAKWFDTWVITNGTRCESRIRAYLDEHGEVPGLHFEFVAEPTSQSVLQRLPGGFYPGYRQWQKAAFQAAQRLHREVGFDLVHQATYCGYREPGYAWKLPIPFVWGGIGGTHNFPAAFLSQAGIGSAISESLRTLANHAQMRWSSHVRSAASASALVLAGNSQMQRHLRDLYGVEAPLFPASGIESVAQKSRRFRDEDGPTRLLWCGNFHALKGLPLVLQAIARLADPSRVRLRIVGSGPMEKSWKALANRLGIEKSIEWTGRIPHHEALKQYNWAEAFVCTSLRETLPGVVLESLAAGVPVITLDHLGMGDAVTPECGFKIPVTDPEQVASDIADAINEVARQPDRWEAMSAAALARANQYTWSSQEKRLAQHYMRVLGDETWQVPADKSRRSVALAQAPAA